MNKQQITITVPQFNGRRVWDFARKWLLPNPGTIILILLLAIAVPALASQQNAPSAASITTIPYQGRLADAAGQPITSRQNMEFRLYDTPTSSTPLWQEFWTGGNAVNVSDGLFSVMLGSINTGLAAVVQSHSELYLGITVGTDTEMSPRVQLGSVPFSLWSLTVADNSITAAKIAPSVITTTHLANGSVTQAKLAANVSLIPPDGSITTAKLANGAVTSAKIGNDAVGGAQIANDAVAASEIAADAVGNSELAPNAVGSPEIIDGSVGGVDIANGTIDQSKAPSLIASGSSTNVKVWYGSDVLTATGTPNFLRKTIAVPGAACGHALKVFIQLHLNFHADVIATMAAPTDGSSFTVQINKVSGTWSNGQGQGLNWMAVCD